MSVLGRKKCTLVRFLEVFLVTVCFTALATFAAFPFPAFFGAAASASSAAGAAFAALPIASLGRWDGGWWVASLA